MRLVKLIVIFALISFLAAAAQSPLPHAPKNRAASTTADPATPAQRGVAQPSVAQPSKEPAATASDPATPAGKDASEPGASGETADGKDVAGPSRKDVAPQANKEASLPLSVITEVVFAQEARIVDSMQHYTPLVETYVQNLKPDKELVTVPGSDRYFLGRLVLNPEGVQDLAFKDNNRATFMYQVLDRLNSFFKMTYHNVGFMQMLFLNESFDHEHYQLKFLRRQFLGEVRTLVFDVAPLSRKEGPFFVGRIWVEDQDYNIVRFNGTWGPNSDDAFNLHFDSWRINMQPGIWLPAYVYTEETNAEFSAFQTVTMKGQTRLWGYDMKHSGQQSEFTTMQVESKDVTDESGRAGNEINPVQSQHLWEREAEDNVLDRMERAGILAPDGEVSKILQTVVTNLEITNNLNIDPEVRCRVLLTTPLESFTIGHTIVLSRGLLDTMPDEATLAVVLAQELGHIALGHRVDTRYGFSDRMIFPDERVFKQIGLAKNDVDEHAADLKGLELLQKSPYKDKLSTAGLFMRALDSRKHDIKWLISPHFGNRFTRSNLIHVTAVDSSPQLETKNVSQLPALPLGSRIRLDPWDDHVEMQKGKQVPLLSARDKMSFEVAPMFPNLVRFNPTATKNDVAAKTGQ
ncbi:MAG TPA: M48 family metalloprotease [Candidatus Angelobacter sp.]|nr:M48 family metalloprotease [Candidatus Angelobacter sp.]